jgi:hypothetical protein
MRRYTLVVGNEQTTAACKQHFGYNDAIQRCDDYNDAISLSTLSS